MAIVTDMTVILDDYAKRIGDPNPERIFEFETLNRKTNRRAILMFMVRGLNHATDSVPIYINDEEVGSIKPERWYNDDVGEELGEKLRKAARRFWRTQIVEFAGDYLKSSGDNKLRIHAVGFPESSETNQYDDFWIRDIVCHFKQET